MPRKTKIEEEIIELGEDTEEETDEDFDEEAFDDEAFDDDDYEEEDEYEDEEEEEDEYDLGVTKERVAEATSDFNSIYKEGAAVAKELKGAYDDIKSAFNLGGLFK